jgi:hypothetical protein
MKESVTIVAGGWSASRVNLRRLPGYVIAVNDAAIYAPRVDAIVSMDRLWMEHRFAQVSKFGKPIWLRSQAVKGDLRAVLTNPLNLDSMDVELFDCDHESTTLSDERGKLNGTHSGFCALNLAYQMRPKQLYLVGFDMKRGPHDEAHWYPPYSWSKTSTGAKRLDEWSLQFSEASQQLRAAGVLTRIVCENTFRLPFLPLSPRQLEVECQAV